MAFHHLQLLKHVLCLLLWACPALLAAMTGNGSHVTMQTTLGVVRGTLVPGGQGEADVKVFYGIPFAKPPLGDLRFKAPVCHDKWTDVRDATQLPNSCWQALDTAFNRFPGVEMWNPNTPRSEDCLYVNAWVPATPTQKPIMVWIFGGGFWAGTTTLAVYDALKLAARHDVIVVSIAYRLGVFGFLYSGNTSAPGNAGMLDQVMALHWVKGNAASMGGDASKVTLFGESAGAASVGYHLLSPLSKDLFNRGIMLSSTPVVNWGVQSQKTAVERLHNIAKEYECEGTVDQKVECLRRAEASTLADNQWGVVSGAYFDAPFALVVDGDFLLDHPDNLVKAGKIKDANVIAGVVKNEGIYWLMYGFPDVFGLRADNPVNREQFMAVIDGILKQYNLAYDERHRYDGDDDDDDEVKVLKKDVDELIKNLTVYEYYDKVPPTHRMDYLHALDAISGDVLFKCSVHDYCSAHRSHRKGDVFMYSFEHRLSNNVWPSWFGVAHGYEIEVVLGLPFLHPANYTDAERDLSERVMKYFSNFAKTGDPNKASQSDNGGSTWPAFTLEQQEYHVLDLTGSNSDSLRYGPCVFWGQVVPKLKQEGAFGVHQPQTGDPDGATLLSNMTLSCLLMVLMGALGAHLLNVQP